MNIQISFIFKLLPEFGGESPPKTLVLFSDGIEHQTGFYESGEIITDHKLFPVNIKPKYWCELKNIEGVIGDGYWCLYCNRLIENDKGIYIHDDIVHPDDFTQEESQIRH